MQTEEHKRLAQIQNDISGWRRWGPYVGDRSWATVGVAANVIEASWQALVDAITYGLMRHATPDGRGPSHQRGISAGSSKPDAPR